MSQIKKLEITNTNDMYDEIKRKINSGNSC